MPKISPETIARQMVANGIAPQDIKAGEFDHWTDTLMEAMQDLYDIETKVRQEIEKMPDVEKCLECGSTDIDHDGGQSICAKCHLEWTTTTD